MGTTIRCYDYVNHPYQKVCDAIVTGSKEIFGNATKSAESRAEDVAAGLHVNVGGIEIGKEILIDIQSYTDVDRDFDKKMTVDLEWKAAEAANLFPTMDAKLDIYPLSGSETQLDFQGEYEPPFGILGKAIDKLVGHRIAEASVHHFVNEVADYLRKNLG